MLFVPIAAAHLAAFLAIQGAHAGVRAPEPGAISVFAVRAPASAVTPPSVAFMLEPVSLREIVPPDVAVAPEAAAPASAGEAAAAVDCDLTATVQTALRGSAAVKAALVALPVLDRSVANAVMLWDGRWVDGASAASRAPLAAIRAAVAAAVAAAPAACRAETQRGPRLFALAGPPDTVLALGSGSWRWGDLASP